MIDCNKLREGRGIHAIPNLNATLPSDHRVLSDKAVSSYLDARLSHIPEIIDMQYGAVHHNRSRSNFDPVRRRVQIRSLIQINPISKLDIVGKPQTDIVFDRCDAVHLEDEPIEHTAHSNPENGGDPAK
jgi:hypothetical protein